MHMMASKPRVASSRGRIPYTGEASGNGMLMRTYWVCLSIDTVIMSQESKTLEHRLPLN